MQYKESSAAGRIFRKFLPAFLILLVVLSLSLTALAATAYEVTKSGGALVRKSYAESADSVYRASQGSILWVNKSKVNSSGNTWYQLTDGYWIFSGNVKKHTCTGTWVSGYNPTCTAAGVHNYRCNKCGNSWSLTTAAWGHSYDGNVCTRCGVWNASSLKSRSYINKVLYVTTNGAKVHSGPYGATSTVTTLNRGTNITATEKLVNASNNVWYRYSGGYIFSDYVVDHSSCSWNSGTVTQKATCTQVGIRVQNCTICGAGRSVAIAKTSHKYSGNICTVCGTWNTSSLKSKTTINNVN